MLSGTRSISDALPGETERMGYLAPGDEVLSRHEVVGCGVVTLGASSLSLAGTGTRAVVEMSLGGALSWLNPLA